jgi:hypothetical protein
MKSDFLSYEWMRQHLKKVDKYEQKAAMLGALRAEQDVREIRRLHTAYSNARGEYDFTKFGVFLYPNENWDEPLLYFDGFSIDHHSTVIRSAAVTVSPAARDTVRLFKRAVLPKSMWMPAELQEFAQNWDVFGIERVAAMDNGKELIAHNSLLVFMLLGVICLRMPPARGDLKGTVERTHDTIETQFVSALPGYVSREVRGMNPRYDYVRKQAKKKAKLTVMEYERRRYDYVVNGFNQSAHPRLRASRISVCRNSYEFAPPIFPTGDLQLKALFALTHETSLGREGVEVGRLKYNSAELHEAYRTHPGGKVVVKEDADDVSSVLVLSPHWETPIAATWTTFDIPPVSQELLSILLTRVEAQNPGIQLNPQELQFAVLEQLNKLQSQPASPTPGRTARSDAQAAAHAAAVPPVPVSNVPKPASLDELLGGQGIDDD